MLTIACAICSVLVVGITKVAAEETFAEQNILRGATAFLGDGTEGVAEVIQNLFAELGRPNAYIKGQQASDAPGLGARYGNGTLRQHAGGSTAVHWSGPSVGFDLCANASKVSVLVYHLPNADTLFQRLPAAFISSAESARTIISQAILS